jgi:hypothetical protein
VGKLHRIGRVIVRVYPNDHLPPHFHVISPDAEALIEIESMVVLRGDLPRTGGKKVMQWAQAHRRTIIAEWNRINPRFPVDG